MINLDGCVMCASATAEQGVVNSATRFHFVQRNARVMARYAGGGILHGCLIGTLGDRGLTFWYLQLEASGELHGGESVCVIQGAPDGSVRIVEHFAWRTRGGSGTNTFDEVRE